MKISSRTLFPVAIVMALVATAFGVRQLEDASRGDGQSPARSPAAIGRLAKQDRTIQFLSARVRRQPEDSEGLRSLSDAWVTRGKLSGDGADFAHALDALAQAETHDPGSVRIVTERARVEEAGHHFVNARRLAEAGLITNPDDGTLLGLAGDASLYAGDLAAAEHYYSRFVSTAPKSPSALIGLSFWAELSGDLERAVGLIEKAPNAAFPMPMSDERQAYVHAVLGEIRAKQGQLAESRRQYELALQLVPQQALALSSLSDLEQWQGHEVQAEKILRGLIERESPNADYQIKLADLREKQGDVQEAKQLRQQAEAFFVWSVRSGYDGYLRQLALLRLAEGDYVAAASLAALDLKQRPAAESRAIYDGVLRQARNAGHPVDQDPVQQQFDTSNQIAMAL